MAGTLYTFTVGGKLLTHEAMIAHGLEPQRLGLEFDEARGLPASIADRLDGVLRQAGIEFRRSETGAAGYTNDELKGTARDGE